MEISLDELLAQTLAGMQEELDKRYGNITAAGDSVSELTMKLRFKKLEIKSGIVIKKFIEEISNEC